MAFLAEVDPGPSFPPFGIFRELFGFVPNLFRAQTLRPQIIEVEARLLEALLGRTQALSRIQKECILLKLAAAKTNGYCSAWHYHTMLALGVPEGKLDRIVRDHRTAGLLPSNTALLDFAQKVGLNFAAISRDDVNALFALGLMDESVLEAIQVAALGNMLCTLARGLGVAADFPLRQTPARAEAATDDSTTIQEKPGPYLRALERRPEDFAPFAFLREEFGFVPNVFRAQTLRPDALQAEAEAVRKVLLREDALTRKQKGFIQLVVSAANRDMYHLILHHELLLRLGVAPGGLKEVVEDYNRAPITNNERALLEFAGKLADVRCEFGPREFDALRVRQFTSEQILEAVAVTALANFFNTLQLGLGVAPDFEPHPAVRSVDLALDQKKAHLSASEHRHTSVAFADDPDAESVAQVRAGNLDAFEELMNRHSRRVYRTLVGILGSPEEAYDAIQDTFLKAFQHLGDFQGRSKFSTWLLSIANNTAVQRLRERRPAESLEEYGSEFDEGFRPKQLQTWTDDPEQLYSRAEMRSLIENGVRRLPAKYRVVLMLRDIEELPVEETAAVLDLGIPATKARLLRGRLMLREALAPHLASSRRKGGAKGATD